MSELGNLHEHFEHLRVSVALSLQVLDVLLHFPLVLFSLLLALLTIQILLAALLLHLLGALFLQDLLLWALAFLSNFFDGLGLFLF